MNRNPFLSIDFHMGFKEKSFDDVYIYRSGNVSIEVVTYP